MNKINKKTGLAMAMALLTTISAVASTTQATDGLAAVVNNIPILKSDVQKSMTRLRTMYAGKGKKIPSDATLKQQATNQLIMRELQLSMVRQVGIRPKDTSINAQLINYAKSQGLSGIGALQKKLDSQKAGSYALLRQAIIRDLAIKALQESQVSKSVNISKQDINAFLASAEGKKLNNNSYQTIHIRVPFIKNNQTSAEINKKQTLKTAKKIQNELRLTNDNSNEQIATIIARAQANYPIRIKGGNMGYNKSETLPSGLATTIVNLDTGKVTLVETDLGIEIVKLADKKVVDDFLVPQWHTRHILIAVNEYQNNEMAEQKINDIYESLRQEEDFARLAATYSDDPSSAGKGGDLEWVSEGSMVPEFEKIMKKTIKGDYSIPFKTQYGWHILQIVNTRNYDASNDVRRGMAKEILFKREAPQMREEWLEKIKSKAYIRMFD